ncbi:hypothetical protein [Enterococcus sp. DIV1420a]|uniref:hypothetical protein n=1 Tax=Enterococcus sp. DIV1420a TaxID=2774672 RepID=UPI003F255E09
MVEQLLKNEILLTDVLKMVNFLEKDCSEIERAIEIEMLDKLLRKFMRFYRQGKLKESMILTLEARDMPYIAVGKVCVTSAYVGLEQCEVYFKSRREESEI